MEGWGARDVGRERGGAGGVRPRGPGDGVGASSAAGAGKVNLSLRRAWPGRAGLGLARDDDTGRGEAGCL